MECTVGEIAGRGGEGNKLKGALSFKDFRSGKGK